MATEKIIQTRILNKIDTLENWGKSTLKIKQGELCFATVAADAGNGLTEPVVMAKIGTAEEKTFAELPWSFYAKASDVLAACKSEDALKTFINSVIADAGIATSEAMETLAGRVTTTENDLKTLKGDVNTAGSVAKAIKDAIDALDLANTYVAKEDGKSLILDTEITRLSGMSDGANKVEASATNGNIKIDGVDTVVYTHPDKHSIDDVTGLQDALDGKLDESEFTTFTNDRTLTDTQINEAVAGAKTHAETKISEFNTNTVAPIAQDVADIKADYTTAAEAGTIAQGKVDDFKSTVVDGIDARVKAIEDAPYATETFVGTSISTFETTKLAPVVEDVSENASAIENITKADGLIATAKSEAIAEVNALANGAVAGNTSAIEAINNETTGILAQAKGYVDAEDKFEIDMVTVNAHGGVAAGEDLNGLTTHEILKKILYPYVQPTVGNATATPNGGTYEKGVTKTITQVSISVTKKSEVITSVALYNGSTLIEEKTGDAVKDGGTITFSGLSVEVPTNGNQLTVKVTDAKGTVQEKKTTSMSFVYPYYMGTCAAGTAIDETLVESLTKKVESKGNKSHSFTVSDGHMVFAYLKSHGALKSILDPNNFETIGNYTRSEVSVTGLDGTTQTYYVYVSGATTVDGFTVNFKY